MQIVPALVTQKSDIRQAVERVEEMLKPDVVFIRYDIRPDWDGDPAIYFRILLADEAAAHRLMEVATRVESALADQFDFQALGLIPYHNFRTVSEQAALREDIWS